LTYWLTTETKKQLLTLIIMWPDYYVRVINRTRGYMFITLLLLLLLLC